MKLSVKIRDKALSPTLSMSPGRGPNPAWFSTCRIVLESGCPAGGRRSWIGFRVACTRHRGAGDGNGHECLPHSCIRPRLAVVVAQSGQDNPLGLARDTLHIRRSYAKAQLMIALASVTPLLAQSSSIYRIMPIHARRRRQLGLHRPRPAESPVVHRPTESRHGR